MSKKIYVDMDGTLCRFHDADHRYIEAMWQRGFYESLQPFEEFLQGLSVCIDRNPETEFYILSAVLETEPPFIAQEKREWLHRHLPQLPDDHMLFVPAGEDKSAYIGGITADCTLIDDYNKNLNEWRTADGNAVKFVNDVNDRGLGAYGGEKGRLWDGERIRYDQSSMEICLQIEALAGIERTGEKACALYGFEGDVLPWDFSSNIRPYFDMRRTLDQERVQTKSVDGETFDQYLTDYKQKDVLEAPTVQAYMSSHNADKALILCLEECYTACRLNGISADRIASWVTASIKHDKAWRTYPVTPSNVRMYITSMLERDQTLIRISREIEDCTVALKGMERQLYLPGRKEVIDDYLLNGQKVAFLGTSTAAAKDTLHALKQEWKTLAKAEYPNFVYGSGNRRFSAYIKNQHTKTK